MSAKLPCQLITSPDLQFLQYILLDILITRSHRTALAMIPVWETIHHLTDLMLLMPIYPYAHICVYKCSGPKCFSCRKEHGGRLRQTRILRLELLQLQVHSSVLLGNEKVQIFLWCVGVSRQEAAGEADICKNLIGIDIAEPFAGRRNRKNLKAQYSYAVKRKPDLCGIITNGFGCA